MNRKILIILFFIANFLIAEKPKTIPALKVWKDSSSTSFHFSAITKIVIDSIFFDRLYSDAKTFSEDLKTVSGFNILIEQNKIPNDGDIFFTIDSTLYELGQEGYNLSITKKIIVTAKTNDGIFYGTRSILQLLKQNYSIAGGFAKDYPDYPERGLMVDVGRHYFSIQFLENQIRELSYKKLNFFHLHLCDDEGFRIESTKHPEIVSQKFYTKNEIISLINLAKKYHVMIIPEFDMPGHMTWILNSHPELRLVSSTGVVYKNYLDLSKSASYTLARDIVLEYIELFPGPYFHLGTDEYIPETAYSLFQHYNTYARNRYGQNALPVDIYLGFIRWINQYVKMYNKKLRIWADPWEYLPYSSAVGLDTNYVLGVWNGYQNPAKITDSGFTYINASFQPTYISTSSGYFGDPTTLYENWAPYHHFGGWPPAYPNWSTTKDDQHVLGAQISMWCESCSSFSENFLSDKIQYLLFGLSQNSWDKTGNSKIALSYQMFLTDIATPIGKAPGYIPTEVNEKKSENFPQKFELFQNFPNPFNPITKIKYYVPQQSNNVGLNVKIKIFDSLGREISTLVDDIKKGGEYEIQFNATQYSSGVYYCKLISGTNTISKKLIILK